MNIRYSTISLKACSATLLFAAGSVQVFAQAASPATVVARPADMGTTATDTTLYNVIFGAYNAIPTGDDDTVFGVGAGQSLTTGREMTIVGARACGAFDGSKVPNAGAENGLSTCIGSYAGANMSSGGPFASIDNVFVGQKAALNAKSLAGETIVGVHAGTALISGRGDVIVGSHSMDNDPTVNSSYNTVVGQFSLNAPGDKTNTVVLGAHAGGSLQNSDSVVIIGANGNQLTTATSLVLIGNNAGNQGTSAQDSVIIGSNTAPHTPSQLVSIGSYSGYNAVNPGTFVGHAAGGYVTTGGYNTCLGYVSCGLTSTGSMNVAVGYGAGAGQSGDDSQTVALGAYARLGTGAANAAQIGAGMNSTANSLQFDNTQVVDGNGDLHAGTSAPASNSPCSPGAVRVVAPYVYACVAPNQWMRAALSSY